MIAPIGQRESIARITAPTLVIGGTHDAATSPAAGQFIAERIRGAKYVELPAAHISNVELPYLYSKTVIDFLRPDLETAPKNKVS